MNYSAGDRIYALLDYSLIPGVFVRASENSVTVDLVPCWGLSGGKQRVQRDKVCLASEKIAVVWESYKGKNGRGSTRIERELYQTERLPASEWPWQKRLWEETPGELRSFP